MSNTAIILAAGKSTRFSDKLSKCFQEVLGHPLLWYSTQAFLEFDKHIRLVYVVNREDEDLFEKFDEKYLKDHGYIMVLGGRSRSESVKKALQIVEDHEYSFVHDGARPCLNSDLIRSLSEMAKSQGNAVPFIPVNDTVRMMQNDEYQIVERENLIRLQTPQCFRFKDLQRAYKDNFDPEATDDSELMMKAGEAINYVEGDAENIKVTYLHDLEIVDVILRRRSNG